MLSGPAQRPDGPIEIASVRTASCAEIAEHIAWSLSRRFVVRHVAAERAGDRAN
jgi:hypothetical protein